MKRIISTFALPVLALVVCVLSAYFDLLWIIGLVACLAILAGTVTLSVLTLHGTLAPTDPMEQPCAKSNVYYLPERRELRPRSTLPRRVPQDLS